MQFLIPTFLKNINNYLLKNKPVTWSLKTHYVIWFWLLTAIIFGGLCALITMDPRSDVELDTSISIGVILSILGLIIYIRYLLQFNVFKVYGSVYNAWESVKSFLHYWFNIIIIGSIIFIPLITATIKANLQFSKTEIANTVNTINTNVFNTYFKENTNYFTEQEIVILSKYNDIRLNKEEEYRNKSTYVTANYTNNKYYVLNKYLINFEKDYDSIKVINDTLHIGYKVKSNIRFLDCGYSSYRGNKYNLNGIKTDLEIINNKEPKISDAECNAILIEAIQKYTLKNEYYYTEPIGTLKNKQDQDYYDKTEKKNILEIYNKYNVVGAQELENSLDKILRNQNRWQTDALEILSALVFGCFCLAVLLWIYRHTTLITFGLSVLSGFLIFITTIIFILTTRTNEESDVFAIYIGYIIAFAIATFAATYKTRKKITGIILNLFTVLLPTLPLAISAYYEDKNRNYNEYNNFEDVILKYILPTTYLLFIVAIPILYQFFYKKWYAAAEPA